MEFISIITLILCIFMGIICFFLFFLYCKSECYKDYACYKIMIISLIIFLDNMIRFPFKITFIQYIQAFLMTFFDKILLMTLSMQSLLTFFGNVKKKFYYNHEKVIFFLLLLFNISSSLIISIVLISYGKKDYEMYSYCTDENNSPKKIIEIILNIFFLLINFVCLLLSIRQIIKNKNLDNMEDINYDYSIKKLLFFLAANTLIIVESFLFVFDILAIDLVYKITCFIIDLFYAINKKTINAIKSLCCRSSENNCSTTFSDDDNECNYYTSN